MYSSDLLCRLNSEIDDRAIVPKCERRNNYFIGHKLELEVIIEIIALWHSASVKSNQLYWHRRHKIVLTTA